MSCNRNLQMSLTWTWECRHTEEHSEGLRMLFKDRLDHIWTLNHTQVSVTLRPHVYHFCLNKRSELHVWLQDSLEAAAASLTASKEWGIKNRCRCRPTWRENVTAGLSELIWHTSESGTREFIEVLHEKREKWWVTDENICRLIVLTTALRGFRV